MNIKVKKIDFNREVTKLTKTAEFKKWIDDLKKEHSTAETLYLTADDPENVLAHAEEGGYLHPSSVGAFNLLEKKGNIVLAGIPLKSNYSLTVRGEKPVIIKINSTIPNFDGGKFPEYGDKSVEDAIKQGLGKIYLKIVDKAHLGSVVNKAFKDGGFLLKKV